MRMLLEEEEEEEVSEPTPKLLNTTSVGCFLEVSKDKLSVRYGGNGAHENDVGAVQSDMPAPQSCLAYYFEVEILNSGRSNDIMVGFAEQGFKLSRHPGWEPNSYGYHASDGKKHCNKMHGDHYGPAFYSGDVVGVGLHLEKAEVFFTLNGKHLGVAFKGVASRPPLYPTIGLHSSNESVEVNLGQKPFRFDIEGMLREEREQLAAAVESVEVPAGVSHEIVRSFLLHYGYAGSLRAFDEAAGLHPGDGSSGAANGHAGPSSSSDASEIELRWRAREHICAGDIDSALELLRGSFPALLAPEGPDPDVAFHLHCQKFIELVRRGLIQQAVQHAQATLAPQLGRSPQHDAALTKVVALVAYEQPEASPLRHLVSPAYREAVADVVNAAMLAALQGQAPSQGRPQGVLERVLRQVVVLRRELLEARGGQGEPFRLRDHLSPPQTPPAKAS